MCSRPAGAAFRLDCEQRELVILVEFVAAAIGQIDDSCSYQYGGNIKIRMPAFRAWMVRGPEAAALW